MKSYDLIVCGAGPAGTMAAAIAAKAGLKVALLEKHLLPRHKTCGGGVPMVMQDFIRDLAPSAFVESDVLHIRHTWNFEDPYLAPINPPDAECKLSIWMVQRSIFDHALAQYAVKSGAELLDGLTVHAITVEEGGVRVRSSSSRGSDRKPELEMVARYVVGADGANGVTAKTVGLRQKRAIALGMEVEFPYQWGNAHPDLQPEVLHLEYGAVQRGYAWIFPKAGHLNIGAGVFHPNGGDARRDRHVPKELRQAILGYLNAFQIPCDERALLFHAHPLPVWSGKEQLHTPDGRVLLAGDAAGLINPFFGDGILHAVKSGMIAANCVVQGEGDRYSDRIHTEFAANFDTALKLSRFFYRFPHACYRYGVKNPKATHAAAQLLAGELPFNNIAGQVVRNIGEAMVRRLTPVRGKER